MRCSIGIAVCIFLLGVSSVQSAITTTGNVNPANPATWTLSTSAYIGQTANGTVTVSGGSDILSDHSHIGHGSGTQGRLTITGIGSTWTTGGSIHVGYDGIGIIDINNGGYINGSSICHVGYGANSTGIVSVDGDYSMLNCYWSVVGRDGDGLLTVTNGGSVNNVIAQIGYSNGSYGEAWVDGDDSTWNINESLSVGVQGQGVLYVVNGGDVTSDTGCSIGKWSNSVGNVLVSGSDSRLTNRSDTIDVGGSATGTLEVYSGGTVTGETVHIGARNGSDGQAFVAGTDAMLNPQSDLVVGRYGDGELYIYSGGLVKVAETLTIDYNSDGDSGIAMETGGMLALHGNGAGSINSFLNMISGTDAIYWWDSSINNWAHLTTASLGTDCWLDYQSSGSLAGYTLLTVGTMPLAAMDSLEGKPLPLDIPSLQGNAVPEPGSVALILTALLGSSLFIVRKKRNARTF